MSKGGEFEVRVWDGGIPIWCELYYRGEKLQLFNSLELRDLAHAVKRARIEAKQFARRMDKDRIEDY